MPAIEQQKRRKSLQQVKSEVVGTDMLHEGSKIAWPGEVRPPMPFHSVCKRVQCTLISVLEVWTSVLSASLQSFKVAKRDREALSQDQ